jgi:hypothetical protein
LVPHTIPVVEVGIVPKKPVTGTHSPTGPEVGVVAEHSHASMHGVPSLLSLTQLEPEPPLPVCSHGAPPGIGMQFEPHPQTSADPAASIAVEKNKCA